MMYRNMGRKKKMRGVLPFVNIMEQLTSGTAALLCDHGKVPALTPAVNEKHIINQLSVNGSKILEIKPQW